jgi:hypothetical protein
VTIAEAVEIMRNMTGEPPGEQCRAMMALADVWEESEGGPLCEWCRGNTLVNLPCHYCHDTGFVSNGNSLRAEALRLLAECGCHGAYENGNPKRSRYESQGVVGEWVEQTIGINAIGVIPRRLALLDAYAAADRPTREAWARETRRLAGWVACPTCEDNTVELDVDGWSDGCLDCYGYGLVPPVPTEVQS